MTPATILAKAIEPLDLAARGKIATAAGVPPRSVQRAAGGRPISADHFIRICAAAGVDPVTGYARARQHNVWEFCRDHLALGIRMVMHIHGHSVRQAAKEAGVSATVMHRLKSAEVVSIDGVLAGCRYVSLHPFGYLKPAPVSRETSGGTATTQGVAA